MLQADSLRAEPQGKPKNTGVGSLSFLQQIFLTRESNWGLLHCRRLLYQLSHQGNPGNGIGGWLNLWFSVLSQARHLQSQLAGMVILWVSMIPRPTVSLPYLAFGFWLVVTPSLHCKVNFCLIMAGPWAFHSSTPSFQPHLEELQKLLGIIHVGSTGWFHYR